MLTDLPPSARPLVLDLDGTVIHTDTFHEMMASLLTHRPSLLFKLPFWFLKGRPYAKAQLVAHTTLKVESLPYNRSLLSFAQQENRPLILATGTDQKLAEKIASHLRIFQKVIGSDGKINMTGQHKARALVSHFGAQGFDYAGDSPIDAWVWKTSQKAFVVAPKWGVLKKAQALKSPEHIHYMPREHGRIKALILALRPLFWILNGISGSAPRVIGFSLLSSGLLILGDLLTLEKERQSQNTPKSIFARGHLHLSTAFIMAPLLVVSAFVVLYSHLEGAAYLLVYSLLFMGFDRLTRLRPPLLRWGLLSLFQLFTLWMVS